MTIIVYSDSGRVEEEDKEEGEEEGRENAAVCAV